LAVISPTKPNIASLAYPLGFLAKLVRVCEESKNMMNKTLVEDRLEESSNFRLHEEDWKTDPEPSKRDVFIREMKTSKMEPSSSYQHSQICTCIYYLYDCHEGTCRRKEPLLQSWIQRDLGAFRGTTHWK
jgi:hypothetical protein